MFTYIKKHEIWGYLSVTQQDLILEGTFLIDITKPHRFKDYSFLVFPFAKAFEGYLKQLFLDLGYISHLDYISDHFRLGKFLTPHLVNRLDGRSIYMKIRQHSTDELAREIWNIWKEGRNEVIHYYPHNLRRLTYEAALLMNEDILSTMIKAYEELKTINNTNKPPNA